MKRFIEKYDGKEFDIIIIGGGITGAAVAYDAASRGLSVALLEKYDFGWATSSANSKLIHGGLRYLRNLEYGLVRESLRERKILSNIAPNHVFPIPFLFATGNKFLTNKWLMMMGLITYEILAFDKKWTWDKSKRIPNFSVLSKKKALSLEPNLKRKGMTGAICYYDCQSHSPERFTLSFIKSAVTHGAEVANYAEVSDFLYEEEPDGRKSITGVMVRDRLKNKILKIKGKLTINCGGPWADIILQLATKNENNHKIRRSEGIHIIMRKITGEHAVTLTTPGGRFYFLIPWRGRSLIGTTDNEYVGRPDDYRVTKERIMEFIEEINGSFGDGSLSYKDVMFSYGGLRPLVDTDTEGTYKSSRKYEIYNNSLDGFDGLITVEGGKWTTSRNLAVNVMKMARKKLDRELPPSETHRKYLWGCEIDDMEKFVRELKEQNTEFSENTMQSLARLYGTEYKQVLEIAGKNKAFLEKVTKDGEILAEVVYAVREEMARTLLDILIRRTGIGTLGYPGDKIVKKVADIAAKELKWTEARKKEEISEVKKTLTLPK